MLNNCRSLILAMQTLTHDKYSVAWLCALNAELAASRYMLDEEHTPLRGYGSDPNSYILGRIGAALSEAGASLHDVVRTRIYIVRMDDWRAVARAHGEAFGDIRPANTLVQVAGLVDGPLVEIEAEAVVQDQ